MKKEKPYQITKRAVYEAFKKVKANKGAPGIDGVTIQEYEENLGNNLYKLWNRMSSGTYFPQAVRGVEIPKKSGGTRLLGVPTVNDRIAQTVIASKLKSKVEPHFYPDSYGYRNNKSTIDAVRVTIERCWQYDWVVEFDVKGLFDNIEHSLLMKAVKHHVKDKWVLLYIERSLVAPIVMPSDEKVERTKGTPQGGVVSAVLSNLFMHYAFDHWMSTKHPNMPWARYADDGLIHCVSLKQAEWILKELGKRLRECQLDIHPKKTKIIYCKDKNRRRDHEHTSFVFLGFCFRARTVMTKHGNLFTGFTPAVSDLAIKIFKKKIKEHCRNKALSINELADKINPIIRGWANHFSHFTASAVKKVLTRVNLSLARWLMRKSKRYLRKYRAARLKIRSIAKVAPDLFVHWQMGICF